jgi:hypothetical protein
MCQSQQQFAKKVNRISIAFLHQDSPSNVETMGILISFGKKSGQKQPQTDGSWDVLYILHCKMFFFLNINMLKISFKPLSLRVNVRGVVRVDSISKIKRVRLRLFLCIQGSALLSFQSPSRLRVLMAVAYMLKAKDDFMTKSTFSSMRRRHKGHSPGNFQAFCVREYESLVTLWVVTFVYMVFY